MCCKAKAQLSWAASREPAVPAAPSGCSHSSTAESLLSAAASFHEIWAVSWCPKTLLQARIWCTWLVRAACARAAATAQTAWLCITIYRIILIDKLLSGGARTGCNVLVAAQSAVLHCTAPMHHMSVAGQHPDEQTGIPIKSLSRGDSVCLICREVMASCDRRKRMTVMQLPAVTSTCLKSLEGRMPPGSSADYAFFRSSESLEYHTNPDTLR